MAELFFPSTYERDGFSTQAMSQHDGRADPVIRELLQNCLDGARRAGRATTRRPLEVHMTVREWPVESIPGIEAYVRAFRAAKEEHGGGTRSTPSTRETCRRIEAALDGGRTLVLFCRDNGHGLNAERMSRLLAEGSGDKGGDASSAGSFGVGHLTAFAASDLRYALYGGRADVGGTLRDSVSGHAVLATHVRDGSRRAGNGYWLDRRQIESFEAGKQPDLFDGDYPLEIPELLDQEMTAVETTGAVVCIVGFNRFRGEGSNVAREIRRVAAMNFLAAIEHGQMTVRIVDEPADAVCDVNWESLSEDLLEFERQRRSRRGSGGGWLVGAQAYAAWTTLREGDRLRGLGDGVDVRIRRLDADRAAGGSRVNVFRTGMWVTNGARHLYPSDFARQNPFDAVVLLSGEGELCRLVRDAEGPEHRTIEEKRIEPSDRERLFELFLEIARRLRAEAGDLSTEESWRPENFAVFRGAVLRGAEQLRPYRPRASAGGEAVVGPKPGPEPGPKPNPDGEPNPRRPKPGRSVKARIAHRLLAGASGFDRLVVRLKVEDGKLGRPGAQLGLRVRRDSGSDESCSSPQPPEWLPLVSAENGRGLSVGRKSGPKELVVPATETDLVVRLAESVRDPRGLQVDIVYRQPQKAAAKT